MSHNTIDRKAMHQWLRGAQDLEILSPDSAAGGIPPGQLEAILYPRSIHRSEGITYALLKVNNSRYLGLFSENGTTNGFEGMSFDADPQSLFVCPLIHANADRLRKVLPHTAPSSLSGCAATFGVGDRLGLAAPGHIRVFRAYAAHPVFAQQSVRELTLTRRSYEDVLDSSTWAVFQEGFSHGWGADGDHLKTADWVRKAVAVGYTMITADVTDYIRHQYADRSVGEISDAYRSIDRTTIDHAESRYLDRTFQIDSCQSIKVSRHDLEKLVLIYREALDHAERLYTAAVETAGTRKLDFELSIDETVTPTSPQAHVFIALECQRRGMKLASLAPRFVGEFQKGIDYIGDRRSFRETFAIHAAIARTFGYRISVHSGSDKFAVFPIIGDLTRGRFHVKTAGTNWLEALRVLAVKGPQLFSDLYTHAIAHFERATQYYHVTPDFSHVPDISMVSPGDFPDLLENQHVRQVLHITYGEILASDELSRRVFDALDEHIEAYWQALERHIGKHLDLLRVEKREAGRP